MYILYLGLNREGKLECKCGIFIVNAEFVIFNDSGIWVSSTFQVLWRFVLLPAKFVA